jgi:hypothetical protein
MDETWRIIIGLIIAGIGGFVAVGTLVGVRSVKRSAAWPQVKGTLGSFWYVRDVPQRRQNPRSTPGEDS